MRFTTKIEYGLVCLMHMARLLELGSVVTVKDIVKGVRYSPAYTEKILQKLRAAKIVSSQQGNRGGYYLMKTPAQITLKEIINALEGGTFNVFCEPKTRDTIVCTGFPLCHLKPVWEKTKDILDSFYDSITLEMLVKNEFHFNGKVPAAV